MDSSPETDSELGVDDSLPGFESAPENKPTDPVAVLPNDRIRQNLGMASYIIGVSSFVGIIIWACSALEGAIKASIDTKANFPISHVTAILHAVKAVIVATVAGFAMAMVRVAERMTMGTMAYLQLVKVQSESTRPTGSRFSLFSLPKADSDKG